MSLTVNEINNILCQQFVIEERVSLNSTIKASNEYLTKHLEIKAYNNLKDFLEDMSVEVEDADLDASDIINNEPVYNKFMTEYLNMSPIYNLEYADRNSPFVAAFYWEDPAATMYFEMVGNIHSTDSLIRLANEALSAQQVICNGSYVSRYTVVEIVEEKTN